LERERIAPHDARSPLNSRHAPPPLLRHAALRNNVCPSIHALSQSRAALDVHKEKLLQCATAIEKEHAAGRDLAQRCDSLAATQALIQQQLQDRLESSRKENARWRSGVEESVKAAAAELAAVRLAHARAGAVEPFPEAARVELRRLLDERDEAHRQQLESLGRAVHSLAGGGHASDRLR
jgi:hypothetical protein